MQLTFSKTKITNFIAFILCITIFFIAGFLTHQYLVGSPLELVSPFVESGKSTSFPLLSYTIPQLQNRTYETSPIKLEKVIEKEDGYVSYIFSYVTLDRKMTGQINIPDSLTASPLQKRPAVVMLRGYVPAEVYETGVGTKNVAAALAQQGYITVAPDFFGYGLSDPEPEDSWITRFEKPITVVELLLSLEKYGVPQNMEQQASQLKVDSIGMWAHSNGGQIALTALEILKQPIPTSLWAPVTAPFPYSILYFSDELADEGKEQRKWISLFEEKYNAFDFSLTQHLESLTGPIQIQHGDADDAALIYWSQEFADKITIENEQRVNLQKQSTATPSSLLDMTQVLPPVELTLITHSGADHNMVPKWDVAVRNDLSFFAKHLK